MYRLGMVLLLWAAPALAGTVDVVVTGPPGPVTTGTVFVVDVSALPDDGGDVEGVFGGKIILHFDPTRLELLALEPSDPTRWTVAALLGTPGPSRAEVYWSAGWAYYMLVEWPFTIMDGEPLPLLTATFKAKAAGAAFVEVVRDDDAYGFPSWWTTTLLALTPEGQMQDVVDDLGRLDVLIVDPAPVKSGLRRPGARRP